MQQYCSSLCNHYPLSKEVKGHQHRPSVYTVYQMLTFSSADNSFNMCMQEFSIVQ